MDMKVLRSVALILSMIAVVSTAGCSKAKSPNVQPRTAIQTQAKTPLVNAPSDFNWKVYVNNYQDLRDAGIDTEEEALEHWLNFGQKEGREYGRALPPGSQAVARERGDPQGLAAFAGKGLKKLRRAAPAAYADDPRLPPDFDWETYVANYGDLQGINTKERAAKHWLKTGKKEGRTYKNLW